MTHSSRLHWWTVEKLLNIDELWRENWALRCQPKYWYWYWLFWRHELASSADLEGRVRPCGYRNGRSKPLSLAVWLSYAAKQYFKGSKGPAWLELTIENWPKQKFGQGSCPIITSLFTKFFASLKVSNSSFSLFSFCNGFNRKSYVKMWLRRQNVKVIVPLPSNLKFFVITKRWKGKKIFESDQDLVGPSQLHLSSYIYRNKTTSENTPLQTHVR